MTTTEAVYGPPTERRATVGQYIDESLAQLRLWMAEHEPDLARAAITRQHVESYLAEIASTRSASTVQTRYTALRLFFAWAAEEGDVPGNPIANVRPLIIPEQPVPVLTDDELRALLAACSSKAFEERRDTAIIGLLLDTGMRRDELVGLRVADVDVVGHVAVVLGKGGVSGAARSATRRPSPSTATCACVRPTGSPIPSGCG